MAKRTINDILRETGAGYSDRRMLKPAYELLEQVNSYDPQMRDKTDDELRSYTADFRQRLSNGAKLDELLPEAYAVVREAARRIYGENGSSPEGSARADDSKCKEIFGDDESPKFGRHYDVQVIGGIMLHKGAVAEMYTGEGKTLVATLPAYLNALEGKGVHVITSNDYLAARDAKWMAPLFNMLGMSVGVINDDKKDKAEVYKPGEKGNKPAEDSRKSGYICDVTYGTSHTFGFDFLRDNMAPSLDKRVQRGYNFAIIDEVDNLLIDEARTPLIITSIQDVDRKPIQLADKIARHIIEEQRQLVEQRRERYSSEIAQLEEKASITKKDAARKAELEKRIVSLESQIAGIDVGGKIEYDAEHEESPNFYRMNPKEENAWLDDAGFQWMEEHLPEIGIKFGNYEADDIELITLVNSALKAHALKHRDSDYVIEKKKPIPRVDGDDEAARKANELVDTINSMLPEEVIIVDKGTGRKKYGMRWGDGLHEAVEAKEGAYIQGRGVTKGVVTLPFYFAKYRKKAGMTGTAKTDAEEFRNIYGMEVVKIPTNKPVIRADHPDLLYRTEDEKFDAVADEISAWYEIGRPVLVGTTSIEKSEKLAELLKKRGIVDFEVLNAREENTAREAEIIAKAGQKGAITIATNMAGRGTDISLGEGVQNIGKWWAYNPDIRLLSKEEDESAGEGGLVVLGTERHYSRRIDNQLRGRAGRQGDPGTTRFYTSLEDSTFWFLSEDWKESLAGRIRSGETVESKMITNAIQRSQESVGNTHYSQRKRLLEFDSVLDRQRSAVYSLRDIVLAGNAPKEHMFDALGNFIGGIAKRSNDDAVEQLAGVQAGRYKFGGKFESWFAERYSRKGEEPRKFNPLQVGASDLSDFLLEENLSRIFGFSVNVPEDVSSIRASESLNREALEGICSQIHGKYLKKRYEVGAQHFDEVERASLLGSIDLYWTEHLSRLKWLKDGIWMRAYGEKDPKDEYLIDASGMFDEFMTQAFANTILAVMSIPSPKKEEEPKEAKAAVAV